MISPVHIAETAMLLLAAYASGCVVGYGTRRILYAARGTRQPSVIVPAAPVPVRVVPPPKRTPAARLAAAASREPLSPPPAVADAVPARPIVAAPKPRPASKPRRQPAEPRPTMLSAPRAGQADNLKQIKGIGPKIEALLNELGVYHLDQIAAWNKANIDWVDGQLAFKGRIRREQWVEQAIALTKVKLRA